MPQLLCRHDVRGVGEARLLVLPYGTRKRVTSIEKSLTIVPETRAEIPRREVRRLHTAARTVCGEESDVEERPASLSYPDGDVGLSGLRREAQLGRWAYAKLRADVFQHSARHFRGVRQFGTDSLYDVPHQHRS